MRSISGRQHCRRATKTTPSAWQARSLPRKAGAQIVFMPLADPPLAEKGGGDPD